MKYLQNLLIIGFIILITIASSSAQTEEDLKRYFEGKKVEVRIDMPATKDGIDIYPEKEQEIDYSRYSNLIRNNGIGIREGDRIMITKIKVKDKHIEFQLGGGGYGIFGDESASVYVPTAGKTQRERSLEKALKYENDDRWRRRMREELDYLRRERESEDRRNRAEAAVAEEIAKDRIQEKRLQAGSRFNIRYDRKLTESDLTPEAIMEVLSNHLYFSQPR